MIALWCGLLRYGDRGPLDTSLNYRFELMSAIGTKQTLASALHMSAFGCRADMMSTGGIARYDFFLTKKLVYRKRVLSADRFAKPC